MKSIWVICISLFIPVFSGARESLEYYENRESKDTTSFDPEGTLYFSVFSPIQNFPKTRDWRIQIEISSQKKISRFFNSDFGLGFHGYNQSKAADFPNCFSFFLDAGLANSIIIDKQKEKFLLNFAYGFTLSGLESTESQSGFGYTNKLLYYGVGTYCKINFLYFPLKNFGIYFSSRFRIIPAWASSNFSYTGYEFAIFPRFTYFQLGINYRVK